MTHDQITNRMRDFFGPELAALGVESAGAYGVKGMVFTPSVDKEHRLVKGLVSTESKDLDGEVILQNGFDRSFFPDKVRAVYLDHQYTAGAGSDRIAAVGVCRTLQLKTEGLFATTYVRDTTLGDDILAAMEDGALGGFSIGFQASDVGPATEDEIQRLKVTEGTPIIRAAKLLEYSFTSMPANPDALAKCVRDLRLTELDHALRPQVARGRHVVIGESVTASRSLGPVRAI